MGRGVAAPPHVEWEGRRGGEGERGQEGGEDGNPVTRVSNGSGAVQI